MTEVNEPVEFPVATEQFLDGCTALVTGASRHLGAAIADSLAAHGARVAVNYIRSADAAADVVARLEEHTGREHLAIQGDVASSADVARVVDVVSERLGPIDVLINNAGPFSMTPFLEMPEQEWDHILNANVKAAYLTTKAVAPGMIERGWGRIVNVSAASFACRNHSIYGLAKSSLIFLTEELAQELGPKITVNAVAPGQIEESTPEITEFDPTFVERALAATPLGRFVTRPEVARVVTLMCGPAFDGVSGATIPIDGAFRFARQ